jgi:anti-sigma factor RsiW
MNCQELRQLLQPYSDGELDLVRHIQIEQHVAECATCAEQEKHLRSLRSAIASPSLYYNAPASLRQKLQLTLPAEPIKRRRFPTPRAMITAGSFLFLIGTTATLSMFLSSPRTSADDQLIAWVVADHIRSVQVDHLTDVLSTDRHTVKPWFQGKLDFAPQVPDLTPQGFNLAGGRLDYLVDRPAAALIYFRRRHAINVFIRPGTGEEVTSTRSLTRQGFQIRHWQHAKMDYWAISDLNDQELDEFVREFQEAVSPAI